MVRSFGLDHLTLLDVSPLELVRLASEVGYGSVGLRIRPVSASEPRWRLHESGTILRELLRLLSDTGIKVHQIEAVFIDESFEIGDLERDLAIGAALSSPHLLVVGVDPDLDRLADNFAQVAELAHSYGMRPILEPMSYRPIRTLEVAKQVISRSRTGGIVVDCLHFLRARDDVSMLKQLTDQELALLQICDGPKTSPPVQDLRQEALSQRLLPGHGEFDLKTLVDARPTQQLISLEAPNPLFAQAMGYSNYLALGIRGLTKLLKESSWNGS